MAAKKQAAKARSAATGPAPMFSRVIEDAELREKRSAVALGQKRQEGVRARLTKRQFRRTKVLDDKKAAQGGAPGGRVAARRGPGAA